MYPIAIISRLALVLVSNTAGAIVIRHDVPDAQYLIGDKDFPALADLPGEGHGVLITPQWVITAAHATQGRPIKQITLNGQTYAVADVVVHPGYRKPRKELESGDAARLMAFKIATDDIALIKLAAPIHNFEPVALYRGSDEAGRVVKIYGKGATGNGLTGQDPYSPHRGKLRRAYNYIISANARWIAYRFDSGPKAHPLEGMLGDGDSGGPVLIEDKGSWKLAGLASWKFAVGDLSKFRPSIYGQTSYNVRISHYAEWIDSIVAAKN